MKVTVLPSLIKGNIRAIPSKSFAHRQLICAALADKETKISCSSLSEDISATIRCLAALGSGIEFTNGIISVTPIKSPVSGAVLDCGESGSTYRFLAPVAAALGTEPTFILRGRLAERPMGPLWETLERCGICIEGKGMEKVSFSGRLSAEEFTIPGDVSSQFISGLLMALPLLGKKSRIKVTGTVESGGYIDMTMDVLGTFGVKTELKECSMEVSGEKGFVSPGSIVTEGDWSNAAFWLCGAAVSGGSLTCEGLNIGSSQGDRAVVSLLQEMGAEAVCGENSVRVKAGLLRPAHIDAREIPDLVPPIALLACAAEGETEIFNAGRLRLKESDRLFTVADTLRKLGADISEEGSSLRIRGGRPLTGGEVHSHGDHRIAMMAALASLISQDKIVIKGAEAVAKSYPGFFEDFGSLGGAVRKEN
ncbi:MAG: 3-phosphoshikimate 1-carboxyvinyltransferase [Synergistaceae bacterium]|jgi:3-phosphoshikimate 1-carboxyvinyltransferase